MGLWNNHNKQMLKVNDLIVRDRYQVSDIKIKRRNFVYESALEFGDYLNLNVYFVMKLFRIYGEKKVLAQRGYMKDLDCRDKRSYLIWKLNQSLDI